MTHEEYEGLISLRALDALSPEESVALDEHLRGCGTCRREAASMSETAAALALAASAVQPPAFVREQLMERVHAAPATAPAPPPDHVRPHRPAWLPWAIAAAALVAFAIFSQVTLQQIRRQNSALQEQLLASRKEAAENAGRTAELQRKLEALAAAPSIQLMGQEAAPGASARLFMNPANRSALVFFQNLPASGPGHSYQLWVIRADQPAPQSAGVFDVGADGKASLAVTNLPVNTEIKAFAVTLEPKGGGTSPTGAKVLIGS